MKLLASLSSPYSRKVRVVLAEKRIECEMQLVDVQPPENAVVGHNPLGKIPTLLLDNGNALYDSRVIVEFLDNVSPINRLIPEANRDRVTVRRWEALADGVLDAGILARNEGLRPKGERSPTFVARQVGKIERGLAQMEMDLGERSWCHNEKYSLADIAVGCCLGWLDFRKPGDVDWLNGSYPALRRCFDKLMKRPAFVDTAPPQPAAPKAAASA